MSSDKLLIEDDDLEYIVEKGKKKAVILKISQFDRLKQLLELETSEKRDGAKALWNLMIKIEDNFPKNSTNSKIKISSHYKKHLYGKNGILR